MRRSLTSFFIWTVSLLYWELFLRVCVSGGIRPGNLALLVFIPGPAMILTAWTGIFRKYRIADTIWNTLPAVLLAVYYGMQLVYYRVTGSFISVAMIGLGGEAWDDFGWTMHGTIMRSLAAILLLFVPAVGIALYSWMRHGRIRRSGREALSEDRVTEVIRREEEDDEILDLDDDEEDRDPDTVEGEEDREEDPAGDEADRGSDPIEDDEEDRESDSAEDEEEGTKEPVPDEEDPPMRRYKKHGRPAPILRPLCLAAGILLWIAGGASLALFGQGRDSAWYAYHSALTDTDTCAERIGTLPTTITESYAYFFGAKGSLSDTVATEVDFDALSLSAGNTDTKSPMSTIRGAEPLPEQKTAASGEEAQPDDAPEEAAAEEPIVRPRVNEAIDFAVLKDKTDNESIRTLCDYFASRKPAATNEYTGLFKDCDLIWLCCESFAGYALDPDITPTLYKMSREGIVLNNFYNSFPNTTTNGEFAFDTSLWPDVSRSARGGSVAGSFPQSANVFMPYGLGDLFTADGADCYAYHNYRGTYYMRDLSWLNLGYPDANTKFLGKGMTFTNPWPASDLEMMEQSVDDYIGGGRYHANYMTFSGHGPYDESNYIYRKNIAAVKKLAGDRYRHSECLGYLCGEYELEQAVKYLTERLEEAGRLENTVIVLIGDHFPYYLSDEAVKEFNGGTMPGQIERNRSSCIIYKAGMEAPVTSDVYCCNVDILPTILNLFDIDYDSRLLMGTDIFSDGVHRARLYNGSFVTDVVTYDRANGKTYWKEAAEGRDDATLDAYLEAMLDYTESEYAVSLAMMDNDFYFYVWRNAGIMSPGEVAAEEARQEKGASLYKDRQIREQQEKEEYLRRQQEKEAAEQEAAGGEGAPAGAGEPGTQQGTGEPGQTPAAENAGQPAAPATPAAENAAQPAAQPAAPAAEGAQQPAQ